VSVARPIAEYFPTWDPDTAQPQLVWGTMPGCDMPSWQAASWDFGDQAWVTGYVDLSHLREGMFFCIYVDGVTHFMPEPPDPTARNEDTP
jgi:hypothetical protein